MSFDRRAVFAMSEGTTLLAGERGFPRETPGAASALRAGRTSQPLETRLRNESLTEEARADHTETVRGDPRDVWQRAVTNGDRRCYFFFVGGAGGALRTVTVEACLVAPMS